MGRPKKEKPNHGNLYEVKVNFAEKGEQRDMRSFYSPVSKEDARRKGLEARAEYKSTESLSRKVARLNRPRISGWRLKKQK